MKDKGFCPHCGAKMKAYRHNLNKGLVRGLIGLDKKGGIGMLRDLNLTVSQFNNFQKLRYWELIAKEYMGSSRWVLTKKGKDFLHGRISMPKQVITFRGKTIEFSTDHQFVHQIIKDHEYWYEEVSL